MNNNAFKKDELKNYENINVTDSNESEKLEIYSYIKCDDTQPEIIKSTRGLIYHNDELVVKTFDYTPEYTLEEKEKFENNLQENFSNCRFFQAKEGTMVRLFYFNNKWHLSTQKRLNAFQSRWGSELSFGQLFIQGLINEYNNNAKLREKISYNDQDELYDNFLNLLDKTRVYVFFIQNSDENRIVIKNGKNYILYHIGTFFNNCKDFTLDNDIYITHPNEIQFDNIQSIYEYISFNENNNNFGVMVFLPNNKQFKIIDSKYKNMLNLRGNDPSVLRRYLFIRNTSEKVDFINLYIDYVDDFKYLEKNLLLLSKYIHKKYVDRFIKKQYAAVSPAEYQIVKECHGWHIQDRKNNIVTLEKVQEFIYKHDPQNLYKILVVDTDY
jgi:hypothetical protein